MTATEPTRQEVWFVTGSQHLYGDAVLAEVERHSTEIAASLSAATCMPAPFVPRAVLASAEAIRALCLAANADDRCIGVVAWMHTFSPARMWIAGLGALQKPLAHLHTQFNRELPWADLDMDFMNLNQSAHGDREFGFLAARMGLRRTVVAGHWQDPGVIDRMRVWARAAAGWDEAQHLRVARFGDNMRDVAVTEGDKLQAQVRLGPSVNSYGIGDLVRAVGETSDSDVDTLVGRYEDEYRLVAPLRRGGERHASLRDAARIELGLRAFLADGGFMAFTDTFEDLGGLAQLPGIAVQRLMADGYGFGAEGDWKTAILVRLMKVMGAGLDGGTSFMEDYTYHLGPGEATVLGAHMLEVCPSIAADTPTGEIHPLSIGRRDDPVRLVFTAAPGPAIVAGLVDLGDRFRMVVNRIELVAPGEELPKLPVARAVWRPQPDLATAAEAWILAGGPHHTALSQALTVAHMADLAEIAGVEIVAIDERTEPTLLRQQLRWTDAYYRSVGR